MVSTIFTIWSVAVLESKVQFLCTYPVDPSRQPQRIGIDTPQSFIREQRAGSSGVGKLLFHIRNRMWSENIPHPLCDGLHGIPASAAYPTVPTVLTGSVPAGSPNPWGSWVRNVFPPASHGTTDSFHPQSQPDAVPCTPHMISICLCRSFLASTRYLNGVKTVC